VGLLFCAAGCSSGTPAPATPPQASTEADDGHELFQKGRQAASAGDSVRAEQYLALALDKGYQPRKTLTLLLKVCLSSSRLRAALDYARPYLLQHPDDEALRYLVANLHVGLQQRDEARTELRLLLHGNDQNADAHYLLGILSTDTDAETARRHFLAYLDAEPNGDRAQEVRSRLSEIAVRRSDQTVAVLRQPESVPVGHQPVPAPTPAEPQSTEASP
jgi:hypothetical protein